MATTGSVVVLFDVDGTLVRTVGASRHSRAFKAAFRQVYGSDCSFSVGMHGMTDLQIFMMLARDLDSGNGRPREMAEEACRCMVSIYRVRDDGDGTYEALPGARRTLETLRDMGAVLGLVTGNVPEIAHDKLTSADLADFFHFGAFGSEADNRTMLPPLAVSRAEALVGGSVDRSRVFVIGDTPRDVACALDNGYRAVAVATGHIPMDDLLKTGADLVLPDLSNADSLIGLLQGRKTLAK